MKSAVVPNPWQHLRRYTAARIALGRAGDSLPTRALLDFGLAHAQARDAVRLPLDRPALEGRLGAAGMPHVAVHSAAADRSAYLRRPDWGRRLDDASRMRLADAAASASRKRPALGQPKVAAADVAFVIADGLSAPAVMAHALPLLEEVLARLTGWRVAPIVIAEQARVALGDEIGAILDAQQAVMLIGERPGLSSPDSLGVYLTFAPRIGRTDAERNCISNVRPEGLTYPLAAHKLAYLLHAARQLGRTGVALKDESDLLPDTATRPPAIE